MAFQVKLNNVGEVQVQLKKSRKRKAPPPPAPPKMEVFEDMDGKACWLQKVERYRCPKPDATGMVMVNVKDRSLPMITWPMTPKDLIIGYWKNHIDDISNLLLKHNVLITEANLNRMGIQKKYLCILRSKYSVQAGQRVQTRALVTRVLGTDVAGVVLSFVDYNYPLT